VKRLPVGDRPGVGPTRAMRRNPPPGSAKNDGVQQNALEKQGGVFQGALQARDGQKAGKT
jgi:hypothetical protein